MALTQQEDMVYSEEDVWKNFVADGKKIGNVDLENTIIVQELVGHTIEQLSVTIGNNTVTSIELKQHLKNHFDLALKQYLTFRDSGEHRQWEKFKGLLNAELKTSFREFCLDFTNKHSALLSEAAQNFRHQVEIQVNSKCLPHDNLHIIISNAKESVLLQYEGCAVLDSEQLTKRLDDEGLLFISKNNKSYDALGDIFTSILPDLLAKYEFVVELVFPDDEIETASEQKFESTFQKCRNEVLKKFNESMTFDVPEMKEIFEKRIMMILGERFSEKIDAAKSIKEKKLIEAGAIVDNTVESFTKSMSDIFQQRGNESATNLRNEKVKNLILSITERIYDVVPDVKVAKQILETAKQKMEYVFEEMRAQRQAQLQAFQEQWQAELNSICDEFKMKLYELCTSDILPDIEELQSKRESIISELIRKRNNLWLDHRGDQKDLRKSFGDAAKEKMENLSIEIFHSFSKVLENNTEQQKHEMNECLQTHNMKMKELLKEELNDQLIMKARKVGDITLAQFETKVGDIVPIFTAATTQLRNDLKEAIAKIQSQFEKQVQNRNLMVKAEVTQLVTDVLNDYKLLLSVCSIASNYGKDKIAQIHEKLKDRAQLSLNKYLKLAKYSGDVKEQQRALETMIDSSYTDTIVAIDNKRAEWNQKLDACNQKSMNHYKHQFNSYMNLVSSDEELKNCHEDLKEQAIELWEESFPYHYFGDIVLPERRKITKAMENEYKTGILQKWEQINLDIDRNTRAAVEAIVKKYENQMSSALNRFDFVSTDMILSNNKNFSKEAIKSLNNVNKPKNICKNAYDDLLSSRLVSTLDSLTSQNTQKREQILSDLNIEFNRLKGAHRRELFDLKVLPEISQLIDTCRGPALKLLSKYKIPENCHGELVSFVEEKLTNTLKELELEWDKTQPDSKELQLAIKTSVEDYKKEMDNRTCKTGQIFVNSAMKKHHVNSLQIVQENFQGSVKQTSATREQFNQAMEEVLKKFEDLNDFRAAEHGEAVVGIDLGTSYSCVAVYKGNKIELIPDREHHLNSVPSYVFYESATKAVVGHSAKNQFVNHPQITIFDSKRLIGRKFCDHSQENITQWPFKVVQGPDPELEESNIEVHGKMFHPEEVSGEILKHLKSNAEQHLGKEVKDVVITIPVYFNEAQKCATKKAAAFANINVLEIIDEPTSAAIAYGLQYSDGKNKNILVFDLGGGTANVTILSIEKCNIVVKASGSDNHLGGEYIDSILVDFCIEAFRHQTGVDIRNNFPHVDNEDEENDDEENDDEENDEENDEGKAKAKNETKKLEVLRCLRQKCEQAKKNLSKADRAHVLLEYILNESHLDVEITVNDFNEMNKSLFNKCIDVVRNTIDASNLSKAQIDDVVLVGGSSEIPEIQRLLTEFFDGKSLIMTLKPDEVVAYGAAYRAAVISGSKSRELAGIDF